MVVYKIQKSSCYIHTEINITKSPASLLIFLISTFD